jgi:hypothetical protein
MTYSCPQTHYPPIILFPAVLASAAKKSCVCIIAWTGGVMVYKVIGQALPDKCLIRAG